MPTIADVRKCTFCGKKAYRYENKEDLVNSWDPYTGELQTCLFDSEWEICKEVGDEREAGTYMYWHDGRAVGRFRELN